MLILFILGLLLGAVAVTFSLQNTAIVTVTFFGWQLQSSLAVVLLLSVTAGMVVCLLLLLPGSIQSALRLRSLKKEKIKLEEELRKQKELTTFAKHDVPTRQEIKDIESGAIDDSEH